MLHVFPRTLAVEYSGWNAYGASWHVLEFGVNRMWPNPFAIEAVIEPRLTGGQVDEDDLEAGRGVLHVDQDPVARVHEQVLSSCSGLTAARLGFDSVPLNSGFAGACECPLLRDVRPVDRLGAAEDVVVAGRGVLGPG